MSSTPSDPDGLTPSERFLLYVLDREFDSGRVRQRDLVDVFTEIYYKLFVEAVDG